MMYMERPSHAGRACMARSTLGILMVAAAVASSAVLPLGRSCWEGGQCVCPLQRAADLARAERTTPASPAAGSCAGGCCESADAPPAQPTTPTTPDREPADEREDCSCSHCPYLRGPGHDRHVQSDEFHFTPPPPDALADGAVCLTRALRDVLPAPAAADGRAPPRPAGRQLLATACTLLI